MALIKSLIRYVLLTAGGISATGIAAMSQGMMRPPNIPGEFKPVVGSGGVYQMTTKEERSQTVGMAIVGKESVEGQDGYWMEWRIDSSHGKVVMKQLMVIESGSPGIKRMIVQPPGRPPMEMPVGMVNMGMQHQRQMESQGAAHGLGEAVGSESVTVPAGTFDTQHYRSTENGHTTDVWVSTKVSPYGVVKMSSSDGTGMVLQKVLENETSQITGEPQKLNFPGMPHQ